MMTSRKLYPLNAKAIKKALKQFDIKVMSCRQGVGSLKGAMLLCVAGEHSEKAAHRLADFGIVNVLGKEHPARKTDRPYYDFGACYMSEEMYNELNS